MKILSIQKKEATTFASLPESEEFHLLNCCTTYFRKEKSHAIRLCDNKKFTFTEQEQVYPRSKMG